MCTFFLEYNMNKYMNMATNKAKKAYKNNLLTVGNNANSCKKGNEICFKISELNKSKLYILKLSFNKF